MSSLFSVLHRMPPRTSDEKGVHLSVCPSVKRVHCDKTEERSVQIFIPYERSFSLVFEKKNGWWGSDHYYLKFPLLPEILGQTVPVGAKLQILNQYSLVARQL